MISGDLNRKIVRFYTLYKLKLLQKYVTATEGAGPENCFVTQVLQKKNPPFCSSNRKSWCCGVPQLLIIYTDFAAAFLRILF
jgi:hypothetical protein